MTTATAIESLVPALTAKIDASLAEWEAGRSCSPSQLDYVIYAREVLDAELPDWPGSTPDGEQFVADVVYDLADDLCTTEDIARFILGEMTADMPKTGYRVISKDRHGKTCMGRYHGIAEANKASFVLRDMAHTDITIEEVRPVASYKVETRLADGSLVDSIAQVSAAELPALLAQLEAERAENPGAIVGRVVVTEVAP